MPDRLRETTVGEICEVFDGPHATPAKTSTGPIFLGITSLNKGRIDLSESEHLSEEDFLKWTRRVTPRAGDVVFSYETKLGEAAIIPEGLRCCLGRRMALMRPHAGKADSRFLLYNFLGPEFQHVIRQRTIHGSTVERLALIEFPKFPLRLPPLSEQRAIASVLGALDDKIELNQRMNETLEALAQSLFKSWFVDFDPVRENGGQFQDSAIGKVPKIWILRAIRDQVEAVFDGPHATPPEAENGGVYLGIKNFTGTQLDFSDIRYISEGDWSKWTRRVTPRSGDIVFTYEATLGFFALIPPWLRCCLGRRTALVRPKESSKNGHYLFHYFVAAPFQEFLRGRIHPGSTVDRILLTDFPEYPVLVPPLEFIERFEEFAKPVWTRIHSNIDESRTLAALRDALLPKLLSGELRAPRGPSC